MKKTQRSFNSTLRSSSRPGKRKGMKRGRKKKPSMAPFYEAVYRASWDKRCASCGIEDVYYGKLDAHHLVKAQRLDDDAKLDSRNGVLLCRVCHSQVHAYQRVIHRDYLPAGFASFLADHPEAGDPVGVAAEDLEWLRAEGERKAA